MGMFAVLLVRRIGLSIGAWMAVYWGFTLYMGSSRAVIGLACGVATMAFFLPRPGGGKSCQCDKNKGS